MSFPILLNINNRISQHQFQYKLSRSIDFSKYEVALGSVSIYYSWQAITSRRGNNTFRLIFPTSSTTQAFTITIPDGTYTAKDLNNYLQFWSIQNNLYLIDNISGENYYFINVAENPAAYAIQITLQPVQNRAGYTAAAGFPTMPTTAFTPQLQIIDSGENSFGQIVGFNAGTYPAAQQTTQFSINSNIVPQIDPVASVVIGLSNLYNPLANNSQVLYTFTSAGVGFGGLINSSLGQGISYTPMQGSSNELVLSFYDQNMLPLQIIDPNICVRLLIRSRKDENQMI
jgi:hypothetical protein